MKKRLGLAAASLLMLSGPALAADYSSSGFDWDGFYAGIGASGSAWSNGRTVYSVDGIVGANVTSDGMLYGAEGYFGWVTDDLGATGTEAGVNGRLGFLVSNDAVAYVTGGGAYMSLANEWLATVGAGIEFAVSDSATFDVKFEHWRGATYTANRIDASINWYFN